MKIGFSIEPEIEENTDEKKTIVCRNCEFEITSPEFATQPHEHTFRNPAGYSFHVLCFADAPGAAEVGDPTSEASWFAGYEWTFAICKQCQNHLGWWYHGRSHFAGLIATRLKR